jgi:dATP pyrophosphohydrolase
MSEAATFKRPESVLVVVHTRNDQALMLHRVAPSRFWQSVTGSLEPDETPMDAALREIAEETGLAVCRADIVDWRLRNRFPIPARWAQRYAPGTVANTEHVFSLCLEAPCPVSIDPAEHDDLRWMPIAEAIRLAWSWTNRDLLRRLKLDA